MATTFFLMAGGSLGDDGVKDAKPTLTHADAAVILAKYSGFFDRYVDEDADLSECVAFLNKIELLCNNLRSFAAFQHIYKYDTGSTDTNVTSFDHFCQI